MCSKLKDRRQKSPHCNIRKLRLLRAMLISKMSCRAYTAVEAVWLPPWSLAQLTSSLKAMVSISLPFNTLPLAVNADEDNHSAVMRGDRDENDSGESSEDDMNSQDAEASDREYQHLKFN